MRDLQAAADAGDTRAGLAIDAFCRAIAKFIGSYAVVLGGLEMLVFSGGIGERSAVVRSRVCGRLDFFGLAIDEKRNAVNDGVLSTAESRVRVRVVPSEEDLQIALHCRALMATGER